MDSKTYWENRTAREMYEEMETAEQAVKRMDVLYTRAAQYINDKVGDIFDAYTNQTGLTEEETLELLRQIPGKDIDSIVLAARNLPPGPKKDALLRIIKTGATRGRLYKLAELQSELDSLFHLLYLQVAVIAEDTLETITRNAYLHTIFDIQQRAGIGRPITPLQAQEIQRIIRKPWYGGNFSSRLWGDTDALAEAVKEELSLNYITGRTEREATISIKNEFGRGTKAAHRLIRTEANYMYGQAQIEAYIRSGIDRYTFVATLDLKTSETCRDHDGKTYQVSEAQPGTNYPPMHPWCRSTTMAYISQDILQKMTRIARDPVTGKNYKIPANMTYHEWYDQYVKGDGKNESKSGQNIL